MVRWFEQTDRVLLLGAKSKCKSGIYLIFRLVLGIFKVHFLGKVKLHLFLMFWTLKNVCFFTIVTRASPFIFVSSAVVLPALVLHM